MAGRYKLQAVLATCLLIFVLIFATDAGADVPDPGANITHGPLPAACASGSSGARSLECENSVIEYLNQAHAILGLPAYALPADFPSLTDGQQLLILSNLDRADYGLAPIGGLNSALDAAAMQGVTADADPTLSSGSGFDLGMSYTWWSNWAGGQVNALEAYYEWMYDDGPGSTNIDCTDGDTSGCWGHRNNILGDNGRSGMVSSLGTATGTDPSGQPGYTWLMASTAASPAPDWYYTWDAAVADGAGSNAYQTRIPISLQFKGKGFVSDGPIRCGHSCTRQTLIGVQLTAMATPRKGFRFVRWSGGCLAHPVKHKRISCTVSTTSDPVFQVTFVRKPVQKRHQKGHPHRHRRAWN